MSDVLDASTQRLSFFPSENFSGSHCVYQYDKVVDRLERYMKDISAEKRPLLNLQCHIQFEIPPKNYVPTYPTIE